MQKGRQRGIICLSHIPDHVLSMRGDVMTVCVGSAKGQRRIADFLLPQHLYPATGTAGVVKPIGTTSTPQMKDGGSSERDTLSIEYIYFHPHGDASPSNPIHFVIHWYNFYRT